MKFSRKIVFILLIVLTVIYTVPNVKITANAANAGKSIDIGNGWKFRVDPPHTSGGNAKWHVHVKGKVNGKTVTGSEGVDGSASHGDHMNKIPNGVKKKIKNNPKYKEGQKKQKQLEKATNQIKAKKLKLDWKHIGDVTIAIGIVVACTATFFFQGDDIAAWLNLFRALGLS